MGNNVLGDLFQDIASAIRDKTGGTETMKPLDFPTKISEITVGGGGGTSSGGALSGLKMTRGHFSATEKVMTITHGMGFVPDIIFVAGSRQFQSLTVHTALGFSTPFIEAFGEQCKGIFTYGLFADPGKVPPVGTAMATEGFEKNLSDVIGFIRLVTAETFTIGGTTFGLDCTLQESGYYPTYDWYAYGGFPK